MKPERLKQELELLQAHYPKVQHVFADGQDWFRVDGYKIPSTWSPLEIPVVFVVGAGYPDQPYAFFIPAATQYQNTQPELAKHNTPFGGQWHHFSWSPEGWIPADNIHQGSNLWGWVRSFKNRLAEGL